MMEYKKLIVGFGFKEGKAFSLDEKISYGAPLTELARTACDNGADELFIWDYSETDLDHDAVIDTIKEVTRAVDSPVIAGGRVKRLEDVKKYLYAGASAVFLNVSLEENVDIMKEAAERFGEEKIYAYLPEISYLAKAEEYDLLGASLFAVRTRGAVPAISELDKLSGQKKPSLIFAGDFGEESPVSGMAEKLLLPLSCPSVAGAVLTLPEKALGCVMELKQQLKAAGISTDTFESSVQWKNFKLNSDGLVPVIVQDYKSNEVLMLAYMNEEAFNATLAFGRMTYFSRSRGKLWVKGETSGHFQYVKSLKIDCDNDTILAVVKQVGAACHTGNRSCFFTTLAQKEYKETNPLKVFEDVYNVILDRKKNPKEGSYTNYLFDKGIDKILKKLGEEATEIVIAAKNPNPEEVKYEISDFLYHMMVLMAQRGISWEEITQELANR